MSSWHNSNLETGVVYCAVFEGFGTMMSSNCKTWKRASGGNYWVFTGHNNRKRTVSLDDGDNQSRRANQTQLDVSEQPTQGTQYRREATHESQREGGDKRVDVGENERDYWEQVRRRSDCYPIWLFTFLATPRRGGGRGVVLTCLLTKIEVQLYIL